MTTLEESIEQLKLQRAILAREQEKLDSNLARLIEIAKELNGGIDHGEESTKNADD